MNQQHTLYTPEVIFSDDLCMTCRFRQNGPYELSTCAKDQGKGWPAKINPDTFTYTTCDNYEAK